MENKSILKKIGLVAILIILIVLIVLIAINASSGKKTAKSDINSNTVSKATSNTSNTNNTVEQTSKEKKEVSVTQLDDGVKYSVTDEEIIADMVIGDNYFDTQIADIMLNFNQYEGKTIEIEGLYFENSPYTFVGRYSTSNICPDCPAGYSYLEYEWNGNETISLKDEQNWIKVIGTLAKGYDGIEYYYVDVASLEVMNEVGITTVSN